MQNDTPGDRTRPPVIKNPQSYTPPPPGERVVPNISDEAAAGLIELAQASPELHLVRPVNGVFSITLASGAIRSFVNLGIPMEMNKGHIYVATSDVDLERVATFHGVTARKTTTGLRYGSLGSALLMQTQERDGTVKPRIIPPWVAARSTQWIPVEQAPSNKIGYLQDEQGRMALGTIGIIIERGQVEAEIISGPPGPARFLPVKFHSAHARTEGGAL